MASIAIEDMTPREAIKSLSERLKIIEHLLGLDTNEQIRRNARRNHHPEK